MNYLKTSKIPLKRYWHNTVHCERMLLSFVSVAISIFWKGVFPPLPTFPKWKNNFVFLGKVWKGFCPFQIKDRHGDKKHRLAVTCLSSSLEAFAFVFCERGNLNFITMRLLRHHRASQWQKGNETATLCLRRQNALETVQSFHSWVNFTQIFG